MEHENSDYTIAFDPSGNYYEGKGTTGVAIAVGSYIFHTSQIAAAEFPSQMEYWTAVIKVIKDYAEQAKQKGVKLNVVCEDYRLYASASNAQINSNLETPQIIGAIKWYCHMIGVPITMQMAAEVKDRWSDDVLRAKHLLTHDRKTGQAFVGNLSVNNHSLDAVRHCLHYLTFKTKTRAAEARPAATRKEYANYETGSGPYSGFVSV